MFHFIESLKQKNETLFYFGLICFAFAMLCLVLSKLTSTEVFGVSAWIKPFKFSFSTFLFSWAMAWYCAYLPNFNIQLFNWSTIILLGFEIIYIALHTDVFNFVFIDGPGCDIGNDLHCLCWNVVFHQ